MKDQLPSIVEEDALVGMSKKLTKWTKGYGRDRARLRTLVLFQSRDGTGAQLSLPPSKVYYNDRPETEMILYHRDEVLRLTGVIELAEKSLREESGEWEAKARLMEAIATADGKRMKHTDAMENLMARFADQLVKQEAVMAKIAADAAKLAQGAYEHRDKMEIARKGADITPAIELRKRLALQYQISEEEVENILSSKAADVID